MDLRNLKWTKFVGPKRCEQWPYDEFKVDHLFRFRVLRSLKQYSFDIPTKLFFPSLVILTGMVSSCTLIEDTLLPCSSFVEETRIQKILNEHADVVKKIEQVRPGHVDVMFGKVDRCPGKGTIQIGYASEKDRQEIEKIIGKKFYGIPYRGINW